MSAFVSVSDELVFHLGNGRISYLFQVSPEGILEQRHFGGAVGETKCLPRKARRIERWCAVSFQGISNYNLNDVAQEYPVFGSSDHRQPAIHLINGDGNTSQVFRYQSHQIIKTKPELQGLPSARGGNDGDSVSLSIVLHDEVSCLSLKLNYTIYADHDVITRSVVVSNQAREAISLQNIMSSCLDLPAGEYELLHLTGSGARELNEDRFALPKGRFIIDSANGVSSNVHNPFLAVMEKGASEQHGRVLATALVYSGNFSISTEMGEFEAVRILAGINPFNFAWLLEAGESFTTPEAVHVFSNEGLNGMSQVWHKFIRQKVSPEQYCDQPRPSYLNSWEANYFDINESKVLQLAESAIGLGLEMLVVDDGWFEGRHNAKSSLGDWHSDPQKFPQGIESVAAKVQHMGLQFGLWLEPEMLSQKSHLFELHPDWIIKVPGRVPSTGRDQLILDLTRQEVQDYLFERINKLLSCGHINYVKWDMNRSMSEIGSANLAAERQQETAHRYVLGVYRLLHRLTQAHPKVLFENCAAGGNRFDLGMLAYMSQAWLSDMSEPIGRLPIINGASYLYPLSVIASYIAPSPSHINGRQVSLKTRAEVVFFSGARGVSLNTDDLSADYEALKEHVSQYRATASDVVNGCFYRLKNAEQELCWQLSSADHKRVYLLYVHVLAGVNLPFRRVRMLDLDSQGEYRLQSTNEVYSGDALMNMGIDLPQVSAFQDTDNDFMEVGDFASRLFVFEQL